MRTERPDDRTLRARIRDAGINLVAAEGLDALTARAVAAHVGVSAGSVINHYGSMSGLRQVCDEHVVAQIRQQKQSAVAQGGSLDVVAALRQAQATPLIGYLAAVLTDDSPAVAHLVDELIEDAVSYMQLGVDNGMIRPSENPRARAVVLMLWGLGALVMHPHLKRLLGVDLVAGDDSALTEYAAPVYEIYSGGLFTEAFAQQATTVTQLVGEGSA